MQRPTHSKPPSAQRPFTPMNQGSSNGPMSGQVPHRASALVQLRGPQNRIATEPAETAKILRQVSTSPGTRRNFSPQGLRQVSSPHPGSVNEKISSFAA